MSIFFSDRRIRFSVLLALAQFVASTLVNPSATAQVFDLGPSDSALFDEVINLPADQPSIAGEIGGVTGQTIQLNVANGGSVNRFLTASSGSEVNISGGAVSSDFLASNGSEVNISGGSIDDGFYALFGSVVNISGGTVGNFLTYNGSETNISGGIFSNRIFANDNSVVNLFGSEFAIGGQLLEEIAMGEAFTIDNRESILTGVLADGTEFELDLGERLGGGRGGAVPVFSRDATLTVTLIPESAGFVLLTLAAIASLVLWRRFEPS